MYRQIYGATGTLNIASGCVERSTALESWLAIYIKAICVCMCVYHTISNSTQQKCICVFTKTNKQTKNTKR